MLINNNLMFLVSARVSISRTIYEFEIGASRAIRCVGLGSPSPSTKWQRNNRRVSTDRSVSVHQTFYTGGSLSNLVFNNVSTFEKLNVDLFGI